MAGEPEKIGPPPPKLVKLSELEKLVYGRERANRIEENDRAVAALRECLSSLRDGVGFEDEPLDTPSITRLASAATALFLDPQFELTQHGFNALSTERVVLDTVFRASVYNGSDFIFRLLPADDRNATKFLLLLSIGSKLDVDLETIFRMDPQATIGLYLSLVSYGQVVSPEAHARREHLLGLAHIFENCEVPQELFNTLCGAYMHCSYAERPDKHEIKKVIHRVMARTLGHVAPPPQGPRFRRERPTIVIVHEWWWTKHAMYRSYARSIRQLRRDFRLVGICPGKNTDPEAKEIHDEWLDVDGSNIVLTDLAAKIKSFDPDIVYYPSIGMAIWAIGLASLRLAAVQVMSYGHPATSNSPVIDYGIIEEDCLTRECFAETILPLPPNVVRPTHYEEVIQRHVPRETDTVRVGITAMQLKVTWPLIRTLQKLQERSPKKIELYFYSAAHGVGLFSLCRELGGLLTNTVVQERQMYGAYMESLHKMDILLFGFPFGGANSVYDAITVGTPMVAMLGTQPHSMSCSSIIRRAGLPESLIARTEDEYVEAILRLTDDTERARIAGLVRSIDFEAQFYKDDHNEAFVDVFRELYLTHTIEKAA